MHCISEYFSKVQASLALTKRFCWEIKRTCVGVLSTIFDILASYRKWTDAPRDLFIFYCFDWDCISLKYVGHEIVCL